MNPKSKILPKIATAMILFSILLANFSFVQAQAQSTGPPGPFIQKPFPALSAINQTLATNQQQSKDFGSNCLPSWFGGAGFDIKICLAEAEAVLGNAIVWMAGLGLDLTENLFNFALHENLDPARFDPIQQKIIGTGWGIIRDLVNMLFVFILLIIAIAVIVGQETYGIKKALPTFIIIILLINFSLLFSRYVIEFSNTLGEYLYCKAQKMEQGCYNKDNILEVSSLFHLGLQPWKVLETYKEGLPKQAMLRENSKKLEVIEEGIQIAGRGEKLGKWWADKGQFNGFGAGVTLQELEAAKKTATAEGSNIEQYGGLEVKENIFKTIAAATFFGAIILLVAAFVFLSAAILLVIRIVMLWILMIFAPAALLLWALPSTAQHGKTWLSYLLNQAFFFPVLVFFLFLSIQLVTGDLENSRGVAEERISKVSQQLDSSLASRAITESGYLFNYAIVIVLLLASLHFARSMASHGASGLIAFGDKARGMALDYAKTGGRWAGGKAWQGASYWPKYGINRGIEGVTNWATKEGGVLDKTLGRVAPGYMAQMRAGVKENIDELKKEYNRYSNHDLEGLRGRTLTTPSQGLAIDEVMAERRAMDKLDAGRVEQSIKLAKSMGRKPSAIERLKYQWKDWKEMGADEMKETLKKIRSQDVTKAIEEGDEATEKLFEGFQKLAGAGATLSDVATELENIGNVSLAKWMRQGLGKSWVQGFFKEEAEPETQKPKEQSGQGWLPGMKPPKS